jgi:hypothetical protein
MSSGISAEAVSEPILAPSSEEVLPDPAPSEFESEPVSNQGNELANEEPAGAAPLAAQLKAALESLAAEIIRSVDTLLSPNVGLLTNLLNYTNEQTSGLLQWLSGVLGGLLDGGNAPSPVKTPFTPTPVAPPPTPTPAVSSSTSNFLSGSKPSDQAYLMLFGVLALLSIPIIEGMFSLHYRELLKPSSLPPLAIERPG